MTVLIVLHTPRSPQSAVFISYTLLAEKLAQGGHAVTILTPEDVPGLSRVHARWLPLVYPWVVRRRLGRHAGEFDVVIFHSYTGWLASLRRRRFRMVTAFHGLEPLYYRELRAEMRRRGRPLRVPFRVLHGWLLPRLIRTACRRSDAVFCLNRTEARYLETHGWVDPQRIQVLQHGISPRFFVDRTHRSEARELLFVGQWLPMKGTAPLVEAFGVLAVRRPDLRLCCAGTLADTESVVASFPADVRSRVDVHPVVTHDELIALQRRADVFVFPTLSEGFSRALVEAMAAALPIVTTPVGAAPDLLDDGVDALLVPPRDGAAVADAVARLLDDFNLRVRVGSAAQLKARELTLDRVLPREQALLERLARAG